MKLKKAVSVLLTLTLLEEGDYDFLVGNSVKNVTSAGKATVEKLTVTKKLSSLCPTNLTERLLADGFGVENYPRDAHAALRKADEHRRRATGGEHVRPPRYRGDLPGRKQTAQDSKRRLKKGGLLCTTKICRTECSTS